jgi:hypothetical protein
MTTETGERDAVRANTTEDVNARLDREARQRVRSYERRPAADLSARIDELRREWDMERYLEMNAASIAGAGVLLGAIHDRRWLLVPGIVLPFLLMHATQGWCPPVPAFRRAGVRTRQEIDRELYAMKALRGDFQSEADAWNAAHP